jgi:hypothetical protein
MERIEKGELITLDDDSEFVCYKKVKLDNVNYACLITSKKPVKIVVVREEEKDGEVTLYSVDDLKLRSKILDYGREGK